MSIEVKKIFAINKIVLKLINGGSVVLHSHESLIADTQPYARVLSGCQGRAICPTDRFRFAEGVRAPRRNRI